MSLLLDTHAFLWSLIDDPRLPATARQVLEDGAIDDRPPTTDDGPPTTDDRFHAALWDSRMQV